MKATFVLLCAMVIVAIAWVGFAPDSASRILIEEASAAQMDSGEIGIFLTVNNQGSPDRLVSATSSAADVTLKQAFGIDDLPVPVGRVSLASDAAHLVVGANQVPFVDGALLPVTLTFADAGDVQFKARMVQGAVQEHVGMTMSGDVDVDVDTSMSIPTVSVAARPDGDGWRIQISTDNFTFSEDQMGQPHAAGTGHGHVYVGGMKLGRVFVPDYTIGQLPTGSHVLRVTLNTNDHKPYMGLDGPVSATTVIEVD